MVGKQAMEGTRLNAFGRDPNTLTVIGLDTEDGPEHPLFTPRATLPVNEALVLNMMACGWRGAIGTTSDSLVVYGRQRVKAAREANKRLAAEGKETINVRCVVERGSDTDLFGFMVSEDEIRVGNKPMARARLVGRFLGMGRSDEEAAIRFGCSEQTIRNCLVLLDLHPIVQDAIDEGKISASAAMELSKLPKVEQPGALAELLADGKKPTAADVAEEVEESEGESNGEPRKKSRKPGVKAIKRVLANVDLPSDARNALEWVLGEIPCPWE